MLSVCFRKELDCALLPVSIQLRKLSGTEGALAFVASARSELIGIMTAMMRSGLPFAPQRAASNDLAALVERAERVRDMSPELIRCGSVLVRNAGRRLEEFVARAIADRAVLIDKLQVDAAEIGQAAICGDFHEQHRAVLCVTCCGVPIYYKPRALEADRLVLKLLSLIGASADVPFPTPTIVSYDQYGWMEGIYGAKRYPSTLSWHYRLGFAAALLVTLRSGDHHRENVMNRGGWPFFVDLECSFIPGLALDPEPDLAFPLSSTGLELLKPQSKPFAPRRSAVLRRAFSHGCDAGRTAVAQQRHRPAMSSILDELAEQRMRIVLRPTRYYNDLLRASWLNGRGSDEDARAAFLRDCLPVPDDRFNTIRDAELVALQDARIPIFYHYPRERALLTEIGPVGDFIGMPGYNLVMRDLPTINSKKGL